VIVLAGECLNNGIQHNGSHDVRQQHIKIRRGNCTDEQADHPVLVRVEFEPVKLKDGALP
jgi:hypothetical protein